MKRKWCAVALFCLCLPVVLFGCTWFHDMLSEPRGASWSVFFYLCGTDLEREYGAATDNLLELSKLRDGSAVNFLIQTGGTAAWQNDRISAKSLQRYLMDDGEMVFLEEQPRASMGAGDTLGDFLSWGVSNYPADHYAVIIWNHGGGSIAGVAFDELFGGDSLTLDELTEGLSAARVPFDLIGFDSCLMATLESAAAVAPYGAYMVASEEYEPAEGWDYSVWPQYIADHPDASGAEVGAVICDSYYEKCKRNGTESMATLSVVDLSAIADLAASFDAMAGEMTVATGEITAFRQLAQGALRAENYGGNTDTEGYTNMVDLGDLAVQTKPVLSDAADQVLADLNRAISYQIKGSNRNASHGLSVFFPLSVDAESCDRYVSISPSRRYLRFLASIITDWEPPRGSVADMDETEAVEAVQASDYTVESVTTITDDGFYRLRITAGLSAVQSVTFRLYFMDDASDAYLLLGQDNDIEADWETGVFEDNFRGVWPTLNGVYCAPILLEEETDYNLYTIPIMLNGRRTNLRAAYIWDDEENGHFEITGVWDGVDGETGMSARQVVQLQDGDVVQPVFVSTQPDTGAETAAYPDRFVVDGPVVLKESDLQDGEYLYQYEIKDVFGRTTVSDPVVMECNSGDIFLYDAE